MFVWLFSVANSSIGESGVLLFADFRSTRVVMLSSIGELYAPFGRRGFLMLDIVMSAI